MIANWSFHRKVLKYLCSAIFKFKYPNIEVLQHWSNTIELLQYIKAGVKKYQYFDIEEYIFKNGIDPFLFIIMFVLLLPVLLTSSVLSFLLIVNCI